MKGLQVFSKGCPDSRADCTLSVQCRFRHKILLILFALNTDDIRPANNGLVWLYRHISLGRRKHQNWSKTADKIRVKYLIVHRCYCGYTQNVFDLSFIEVWHAYRFGEAAHYEFFHCLPRFYVRTVTLNSDAIVVFRNKIRVQSALLIYIHNELQYIIRITITK